MKEYKYKINGNEYKVTIGDINENIAQVEVNGKNYEVEMEDMPKVSKVVKHVVAPVVDDVPKPKKTQNKVAAAAGDFVIESPLPGTIKEIYVKEGQEVKADDVVCILEAMKMGNEIHAGKDGVVKSINVSKEESVLEGTTIMVIA